MSKFREAQKALVAQILEAQCKTPPTLRTAAFNNGGVAEPLGALVNKVATDAKAISDSDINSAKHSGLTEDQIFEIIVCAAIGQAVRQYDSAMEALETAVRR